MIGNGCLVRKRSHQGCLLSQATPKRRRLLDRWSLRGRLTIAQSQRRISTLLRWPERTAPSTWPRQGGRCRHNLCSPEACMAHRRSGATCCLRSLSSRQLSQCRPPCSISSSDISRPLGQVQHQQLSVSSTLRSLTGLQNPLLLGTPRSSLQQRRRLHRRRTRPRMSRSQEAGQPRAPSQSRGSTTSRPCRRSAAWTPNGRSSTKQDRRALSAGLCTGRRELDEYADPP